MGKIFYLMGKSSSGKDTIYKELLQGFPKMKRIVLYTTRPRREGECDGVEYFFTDEEKLQQFQEAGAVDRGKILPYAVWGMELFYSGRRTDQSETGGLSGDWDA